MQGFRNWRVNFLNRRNSARGLSRRIRIILKKSGWNGLRVLRRSLWFKWKIKGLCPWMSIWRDIIRVGCLHLKHTPKNPDYKKSKAKNKSLWLQNIAETAATFTQIKKLSKPKHNQTLTQQPPPILRPQNLNLAWPLPTSPMGVYPPSRQAIEDSKELTKVNHPVGILTLVFQTKQPKMFTKNVLKSKDNPTLTHFSMWMNWAKVFRFKGTILHLQLARIIARLFLILDIKVQMDLFLEYLKESQLLMITWTVWICITKVLKMQIQMTEWM